MLLKANPAPGVAEVRVVRYQACHQLRVAQLERAFLDRPSPKKTAAKTKNTTPMPESSWVKS